MGKWHLIQNQQQLREIFNEPPLISYREGKSLKDLLVRAKLWRPQLPIRLTAGVVWCPSLIFNHVLSLHVLLIHVLLIHVLSLHVLLIHVLLIQSMFYKSSPVHVLSHASATRYKLIYMPKQSRRILLSPLYNFPLHREAANLNQAQTSAINSVCEFRFSSQNIFVLINENAPETVSFLFPATRCKLNPIYPSAF